LNITLFAHEDDFTEALALAIHDEHRVADCLLIAIAERLQQAKAKCG
jgi:predicted nucleic acid-binding protein